MDIAQNSAMPAGHLPTEAQRLYDAVAGDGIAMDATLAAAIDYSLDTPGCVLNKIITAKAAQNEFGNPKMVYVRCTLGEAEGDSPGVPYVLEIWPKECMSPVHLHSNAVAIIKVLHGSIHVNWFNPLPEILDPSEEPVPFTQQTFETSSVTYITPELYQCHQLQNPRRDTMCATIQCYQYLDADVQHYEYFDFVNPSKRKLGSFKPDSDIRYEALVVQVMLEYKTRHLRGVVCQHCEEETAEVQCGECKKPYCAACNAMCHAKGKAASHVRVSLKKLISSPSQSILPDAQSPSPPDSAKNVFPEEVGGSKS
jgi:hypothetical protein